MKFELEVKKLLEDFNINPMSQGAPSTGPDQGMTSGDINNTFPSRMETVSFKLNKKALKKKKLSNRQK